MPPFIMIRQHTVYFTAVTFLDIAICSHAVFFFPILSQIAARCIHYVLFLKITVHSTIFAFINSTLISIYQKSYMLKKDVLFHFIVSFTMMIL